MKKIIFIIAGIFPVLVGYSQSNAANPTAKKLTIEEANRLNGVAQPTINGVPYSQYKAQQESLKNKQQQAPASLNLPKATVITADDIKAANTAPKEVTQSVTPAKTTTTATQGITASGNPLLIPMPVAATEDQSVMATPATPNTGLKIADQSKVTPAEEIKPSVTPTAPKLPVVPMQTEKPKSKE